MNTQERVPDNDWTFYSVTFKNTIPKKFETGTNLGKAFEGGDIDLCLYNTESMIKALEINCKLLKYVYVYAYVVCVCVSVCLCVRDTYVRMARLMRRLDGRVTTRHYLEILLT